MRASPDHYSGRRLAIAAVSSGVLPVEMQESPALEQADKLLSEGFGLAIAIPHFSKGDFFRVLGLLFRKSPQIRERQVLIPIAEHQRHFSGLAEMASFTNIQLSAIVTPDTKEREELRKGEGKKISWQEGLSVGTGVQEYIRAAATLLYKGGLVVFAPQAGRKSVLSPFEMEPFRGLENGIRRTRKPDYKVAYLFAGIEIPGVHDYGEHSGYNPLKRYIISFGEKAFTRDELKARATRFGLTIDQVAHQIMLDLAPESYRPGRIALP